MENVVIDECKVKPIYALSPQARGKIERPYRWQQDRVVRGCAREGIKTIEEAEQVLEKEITRYNYHQVHSTTGEAPIIRFERAIREKKSLFREFKIPSPYTSIKDIYCLRVERRLNLRLIIRKAFWYTSQGNSRFLQGKARTLQEGRSPG